MKGELSGRASAGISKHLQLHQAHDVGGEKAASNARNLAEVPVPKSVWGTLEMTQILALISSSSLILREQWFLAVWTFVKLLAASVGLPGRYRRVS